MKPFAYSRALNQDSAIQVVARDRQAKFIAGGTNLIDLMKEGGEQPDRLVDITRLELLEINEISKRVKLNTKKSGSLHYLNLSFLTFLTFEFK